MESAGVDTLISYWSTSVQQVQLKPSSFYQALEEEIRSRDLSGITISRAFWRQRGWFSPRREYLRVQLKELVFDICAFPYGNSFTVSWWLGAVERRVSNLFFEIPLLSELLERIVSPATFYEVDSQVAFQRQVHSAVLFVIDEFSRKSETNILDEHDPESLMGEFYE